MLLSSLPLLIIGLTGCFNEDYRPRAVGQEGTVTVVIDSAQWEGPVGEALRGTLGGPINTLPQPEPAFDLRVVELASQSDYERVQNRKNVVFASPLSDSTSAVTRFLRDRLSEEVRQAVRSGQSVYVKRPNLWRRAQMVVYLTADTPSALAQKIRRESEDLRATFNRITRQRVTREMFEKGRQRNLEDTLMNEHGFAVNVQHDYKIAIDTTTNHTGFVWLRRVLAETWRSLFIYYADDVDPSVLSPKWIQSTRDSLTQKYIRGETAGFMKIDNRNITDRRRLTSKQLDFLGRYGYEVRGVWTMVAEREDGSFAQLGMGGPFVSYAFYDRPSGRVYLIDGAVFAPKYDKRAFLRQMEVIAYTFRTREETSAQTASANEQDN